MAAPGYLVANVVVQDPAKFEEYRLQVPAVIAQYGGRYVVRGGQTDAVEKAGNGLARIVVLEFPNLEAARRFYHSPEYAPLIALRKASTQSDVVLIEGYAP